MDCPLCGNKLKHKIIKKQPKNNNHGRGLRSWICEPCGFAESIIVCPVGSTETQALTLCTKGYIKQKTKEIKQDVEEDSDSIDYYDMHRDIEDFIKVVIKNSDHGTN